MDWTINIHPKLLLFVIIIMLDSVFISEIEADNCTNLNEAKEDAGRDLEARKKQEQALTERIMPFMIIPFMISTALIPMMLVSLKFMLLKSAFVGKLALLMFVLNLFRRNNSGNGGVFEHDVGMKEMSMAHYGYNGGEEYGAYIN